MSDLSELDLRHGLNLMQRINAVMVSIGDVAKDSENKHFNYKFRGIEKLAPRVRDALVEHGVVLIPTRCTLTTADRESAPDNKGKVTVTRTASVVMTYTFFNADKPTEYVEVQIAGESNDVGDKAVQKALTFAQKYLYVQAFCIGDAENDPDAAGEPWTEDEGPTTPPNEWSANEDEVATLQTAVAMLSDESKDAFRRWWVATGNVGNLREGRVNGRYVPAAMGMVKMLLEVEDTGADQGVPAESGSTTSG